MTDLGDIKGVLPGCVWDAKLFNAAAVAGQGGVLTGAPTVQRGVTLDGATQYVTYPDFTMTRSPQVTVCVEFVPGFALDSGTFRYIYEIGGFNNYNLFFHSVNALWFRLGGVVMKVGYAALLPYWRHGLSNKIVISGESGSTQAYLNSALVHTSAVAWAPTNAPDMAFGATLAGTNNAGGKFTQFHIHNRLWTQADVDAWQSDSLFNYRNKASLYLPMRVGDVSSAATLDRSGNGNNAAYGAGAAAPTKLVGQRGYSFDGGDYFLVQNSDTFDATGADSDGLTISWLGKFPSQVGANTVICKGINTDFDWWIFATTVSISWRGNTAGGGQTWVNALDDRHHVYALTCAKGATTATLYRDGEELTSVAATLAYVHSNQEIGIGATNNGGLPIDIGSDINCFGFWKRMMSPLQIAIEHKRLMEELRGDA